MNYYHEHSTVYPLFAATKIAYLVFSIQLHFQKAFFNHSVIFHRPIKGICGLTCEIIVGLIANLETRELRRKEYHERDLPPEHPRASSTDDVEGIIALFHEVMGDHFDLKQFYDEFPKVMSEFAKRIDPDLSFFYWTGHQTRYRNFALPSFNVPSTSGIERLDKVRISRRGNPGVFIASRGSMAQPHGRTTRATHHRDPVPLPPVNVT